MSTIASTIRTIEPTRPLTMQALLERIEKDPDLVAMTRRDWRSAIKRLCELADLEPSTMPATPAAVRACAATLHAGRLNLRPKTLQNIRSNVTAALRHCHVGSGHLVGRTLCPDWQRLWQRLPDGDLHYGLSRLIRFCDAHGVAPDEVDDGMFERFRVWLENDPSINKPDELLRRTLRLWNKASHAVPGWPRTRFAIKPRRRLYCLDWEELPDSFRRDADAFLARLACDDVLAFDAPPRPLRATSIATYRFRILQLASALVRRGSSPADLCALADLVEPRAAQEALRFFYERAGNRKSSQMSGLAHVLVLIAKYWCRHDEAKVIPLAALRSRLAVRNSGLSPKVRQRLRQFLSRANVEALMMLPQQIHERVRRRNRFTRRDLLDMQVAVMIELLLMMPIRRGNLCTLRIGPEGHLIPIREGRFTNYRVVIPEEEVKNQIDLEFPVPPVSSRLLQFYLERCQPELAGGPSAWLFPGERPGTHKSLRQFSNLFFKTIFRLTGLEVHPHLMRHIGAKLYLDQNPGAYEVVRRVLAHKALSTTLTNYTGLETEAAIRHYDSVILGIRESIRREVGDQ